MCFMNTKTTAIDCRKNILFFYSINYSYWDISCFFNNYDFIMVLFSFITLSVIFTNTYKKTKNINNDMTGNISQISILFLAI